MEYVGSITDTSAPALWGFAHGSYSKQKYDACPVYITFCHLGNHLAGVFRDAGPGRSGYLRRDHTLLLHHHLELLCHRFWDTAPLLPGSPEGGHLNRLGLHQIDGKNWFVAVPRDFFVRGGQKRGSLLVVGSIYWPTNWSLKCTFLM